MIEDIQPTWYQNLKDTGVHRHREEERNNLTAARLLAHINITCLQQPR